MEQLINIDCKFFFCVLYEAFGQVKNGEFLEKKTAVALLESATGQRSKE